MTDSTRSDDLYKRARALAEDLDALGYDIAAALAEQIAALIVRGIADQNDNIVAFRNQIS